jgi:hypothetical protein
MVWVVLESNYKEMVEIFSIFSVLKMGVWADENGAMV